jgi:hypothetical protein
MSKKDLLTLTGVSTPVVALSPAAFELRDKSLEAMEGIIAIESPDDVEAATAVVGIGKGILKSMEAVRKAIVKPLDDAKKAVKEKADEFGIELNKEIVRIEGMLSDYAFNERKKAQAAALAAAEAAKALVDVVALYAAFPHCVKLEPKRIDIRDLIRQGVTSIPGVEIRESTKVSVKSISPAAATALQ